MIGNDLEKIETCADQTLERAGASASSVNAVFLTGGTSKTPIVQRLFSEKFKTVNLETTDAFTSVVAGLARSIPCFGVVNG